MIDTDKYEGMTYNNDYKMGIELEIAVGNLLAEVKRLRQENDELHAQRVQFSWIQEARGGQSDAPLLLEEVKRWHKVRDYILEKASYPTVKKLHLKDLLNFMEEVGLND